jgi:hypothetical protein
MCRELRRYFAPTRARPARAGDHCAPEAGDTERGTSTDTARTNALAVAPEPTPPPGHEVAYTKPAAPALEAEAPPAPEPETPPELSVIDLFVAGYRAAGGPEHHLSRIIHRVIPCESTGNPRAFNRVGPFYGLMQFLPSTWYAVGGGNWFDPWQQGANTARLLHVANPATQWPVCWFA